MTSSNKDNSDVLIGDEGVRHELISTSSTTINRRLRRDATEEPQPLDTQSEKISPGKAGNISVGIPEKFITSSTKESNYTATVETTSTKIDGRRRSVAHPRNSHSSSKKSTHRRKTSPSKRQPLTKQSSSGQKKGRARGTLYGLSTLRRQGNVRVNVLGDHTNVKSNFVLGPLVLKVEKAFGRGAKRELKSATATTTQMIGRISLRIINGAATLHSIKVQQPKQVN